jgi:hypothetical protein
MKDEKGNYAGKMSICDASPHLLHAFHHSSFTEMPLGKGCRRLLRMLTTAGTNAPNPTALVHPS